jgi:hypothetical protein
LLHVMEKPHFKRTQSFIPNLLRLS